MKYLLKNRLIVIIFLGLTVGVIASWKIFAPTSSKPRYQTAQVERGIIVSSVSASGQVITTGRMPVLSQASGQVSEVFVKNGQSVVAGQKILSLNLDPSATQKNASALSSYLSSKNQLSSAQANMFSTQSTMFSKWKTFKDLAESAAYDSQEERALAQFHIAEKDWLAAQSNYKNQQSVVAAAQAGLSSAWLSFQQTSPDLVAPASGIVEDLTYVPGMIISSSVSTSGIIQSQTIASIVSDVSPIIAINLSEVDVNKVSEGNNTTITFDSIPDKTFTGKIVGVNKTGVVSSGVTSYPATIQLDTNPREVLSNMSATANIILESKSNVLIVPSEAIQIQDGRSFVRVLKNGQVSTVSVQTGLTSETETEIIAGLSPGETVVTGTISTSNSTTGQSPFGTFRVGGGFGGGTQRGATGR